jgi:hypothetical protein
MKEEVKKGEVQLIGTVKTHPKRSVSKNGLGLCTLDVAMPKKWKDPRGQQHVGRDYVYRVRYVGDKAIQASNYKIGDRVSVSGTIDKKNYMNNWERERKYWAYIQGTDLKIQPKKKKAVVL